MERISLAEWKIETLHVTSDQYRERVMEFSTKIIIIISSMSFLKLEMCGSILWERLRCSADAEQRVPEGAEANIGRYPWLGVVQHSFYIGGVTRFAVTGGVLIHPAYAVAPAEDIAKILPDQLTNNTKFIVWYSKSIKYSLDVKDYILHPEYEEKITFATIALLELLTWGETGVGDNVAPVLPICMPAKGAGTFVDLYAVRMTDVKGELQKEVQKMIFVKEQDCEEFYYRAQLTYKMMAPVYQLCATSQYQKHACVWDAGVALITRQSWGYWKLLGFGVRGPGCGAPARFLNIHDYLPWLDEMISRIPFEQEDGTNAFILRQLSPIKLTMYKGGRGIPKEQGQCDRHYRGHVLYKDNSEVTCNKNFAQGFFFVSIAQVAEFTCLVVELECNSRTNAAMWIEHHCLRDVTGTSKPGFDYRRLECFLYFKSAAYIEFRFFFSFRVVIELTLYGREEIPKRIPNPFKDKITTDTWWPTTDNIRWNYFVPVYLWWYWM